MCECVLICVTAQYQLDACVCDRSSHAIITLPRAHIKELIHFGIVSGGRKAIRACGCLRVSLAANRVARSQIGPLISKIISCHSVVYGLTNCIRPGEPRLLSSSAPRRAQPHIYKREMKFIRFYDILLCVHARALEYGLRAFIFRYKLCVALHLPGNYNIYIYTWAIVRVCSN